MKQRIIKYEIDILSRIGHVLSEQSVQYAMEKDERFKSSIEEIMTIVEEKYDRLIERPVA